MQSILDLKAEYTDGQLVAVARTGDHDAFSELIRRHRRTCLNVATSILRNRSEAEEEAQNACWKAFAHLDQFHGDAEFSTWLLRIVENQCLMLIRKRQRAHFVYLDAPEPDERGSETVQLPAHEVDPEGQLGNREVINVLQAEIKRIPPLLRRVLILRDVQELALNDIARELGITVSAAKSRLLRARLELKERMIRHCGRGGAASLIARTAGPPKRVFHRHAHM